jgi:hypothetical protein
VRSGYTVLGPPPRAGSPLKKAVVAPLPVVGAERPDGTEGGIGKGRVRGFFNGLLGVELNTGCPSRGRIPTEGHGVPTLQRAWLLTAYLFPSDIGQLGAHCWLVRKTRPAQAPAPPYGLNGLLLDRARRPPGRRVRWKLLLGPTLLSTPKLLSYEIRLSNATVQRRAAQRTVRCNRLLDAPLMLLPNGVASSYGPSSSAVSGSKSART